MRCFVVAGFLLTSASRGPSAIAELLVNFGHQSGIFITGSSFQIGKMAKNYELKMENPAILRSF